MNNYNYLLRSITAIVFFQLFSSKIPRKKFKIFVLKIPLLTKCAYLGGRLL